MSLVSTRSAVIAAGVAVCAVATFARPARSWALNRYVDDIKDACPDVVGPIQISGYFPNPDIIVLGDYDGAKRKLNGYKIRIEMDIPVKDEGYLPGIQTALKDGATTDAARHDLYDKIASAGKIDKKPSAGLRVLKAAIGCIQAASPLKKK